MLLSKLVQAIIIETMTLTNAASSVILGLFFSFCSFMVKVKHQAVSVQLVLLVQLYVFRSSQMSILHIYRRFSSVLYYIVFFEFFVKFLPIFLCHHFMKRGLQLFIKFPFAKNRGFSFRYN